ncbi:MAG: cysteine hydrolase [Acidobacteria bacterium]|nr:cysteine hydrolase [Acidobacteriota bacterium]
MKPALLIIDMQNAFCRDEGSMKRIGLNVEPLRASIPHIQKLMDVAHQTHVPVIFTRYVYQPDYSDGGVLIEELFPQIKDQDGLKAGTWDIEIIDDLEPSVQDIIIDKNRYSAFYNTPLDSILQQTNIDTLIVTGVTTNMCVESTVRDAHYRDYRVWVVREATAEVDPQRHEAALTTIAFGFGRVISVAEAMARLRGLSTSALISSQEV